MENLKAIEMSQSIKDILLKPLPVESVSPHPTKKYLSSIKAIYVVERLNEAFGVGNWRTKTEIIEKVDKMVVVRSTFTVNDTNIEIEAFGGNDNLDLGDAYKGAATDALTKIGSYLGIGMDVFKGKNDEKPATPVKTYAKPVAPTLAKPTIEDQKKIMIIDLCKKLGFVGKTASDYGTYTLSQTTYTLEPKNFDAIIKALEEILNNLQ